MGDLFASGGTSAYPTSLDTFTSQADATPSLTLDTTTAHSAKVNNLAQAIINLETYLGTRLATGALYTGTATNLASIAAVAAGSYLRSAGVSTAPVWSTLILPNAATVNQVVFASSANTYGGSANLVFDGTNLGIGTASPVVPLDVVGRARSTSSFYNQRGGLSFDFVGTSLALVSFNATDIDFRTGAGTFAVPFSAGSTSRMYIQESTGNVGIGTTAPAASTLLDLTSTTGAFLPPRMTTTQRDALTATDGMLLYNSTTGALNYRKAGVWTAI